MAKRTPSEQAQVAGIIRKALKAHGVAGTVRSESASMMTAVRVNLVDPTRAQLAAVEAFCEQYTSGSFNGMEDMYEYDHSRTGPTVKYITVNTDYSDDLQRAAYEAARAYYPSENLPAWDDLDAHQQLPRGFVALLDIGGSREQIAYRVLRDRYDAVGFWRARKKRVRVCA